MLDKCSATATLTTSDSYVTRILVIYWDQFLHASVMSVSFEAPIWQSWSQEKCSHYCKDGNLYIFILEFEEQNHR